MERVAVRLLAYHRVAEYIVSVACVAWALDRAEDSEEGACAKLYLTKVALCRLWCLAFLLSSLLQVLSHCIVFVSRYNNMTARKFIDLA